MRKQTDSEIVSHVNNNQLTLMVLHKDGNLEFPLPQMAKEANGSVQLTSSSQEYSESKNIFVE